MSAPYAGAPVTQHFRERWLSGKHIGSAKPVGSVQIRRGRLVRHMHPYPGLDYPAFGDYPEALGQGFWYPDWQVNSAWMPLDGIQNIKLDQSFDNNGVQTCTITMDNVALVPKMGAAGILYHLIEKGYYSPLRGYVAPKRPDPGVKRTPFFEMLPNAQIRIQQGYGPDQMVTTFLGLIDDVESDSVPPTLTLTARDFGGVLVDELFFGWAKEKLITPPLTFAPRPLAEKHRLVGGGARASSEEPGYPADGVTKADANDWMSERCSTPDVTQWIEIHLPGGKFSQLYVQFPFEDMECYIGVKPVLLDPQDNQTPESFRVNGQDAAGQLDAKGFYNPNGTQVPGANGGWSYFRKMGATKAGPGYYWSLGRVFECQSGTIVRLGFQNLAKVDLGYYRAGVAILQVNDREFRTNAIEGRYVVIDDVSDIVRCCLRWAGFKGWEVENTGTNLKEPYVADQAKTFMDVINVVKDMVGFTFFIGEPRDDTNDQDLGYPIFRNNRVLENYTGKTEFIDDKLLLTDAKVKISNQNDRSIIRCRGVSKDDGVTLGSDRVKRIMFAYLPLWAGEQSSKVAGVIKPLTHTDEKFTRVSDCQFACYLIALQIALQKYTCILDLPCNPGIGLDTLQSVIDRTQGLNSRVYVTNRSQEMQFGSGGHWTMEIGGSVVDSPDVASVVADYKAAIKVLDRHGKNPWLRKRHGKPIPYGYQDR